MIQICEKELCTACNACVQRCPKKCIYMQEDANGFMYPAIDADKCIECRQCIKVCHNNKVLNKGEASFYMGWHKDLEVLRRSSSGGAFTALADIVLERGGVVFGASFNEKTRCVEHVAIERKDQLDLLRLSKYYQGSIGNCYDQAKEALKTRWVLFSGTSCQIAGLYAYLDRDYDNLITVEILCHGITSKHVVDEYIKSKEKKYKKKIRTFRFRIKPEDGDWVMGGERK